MFQEIQINFFMRLIHKMAAVATRERRAFSQRALRGREDNNCKS